jgi:tetratricopeptide (TPR) repeat protein
MRKTFLLVFAVCAQLLLVPLTVYSQETREDAEAYYKLGQAYYDQGKFKEAEEYFQKAVNILNAIPEKKESAVKAPAKKAETPKTVPSKAARKEYVIGDDDVLISASGRTPTLRPRRTSVPTG